MSSAHQRLFPRLTNSRYYPLTRLRIELSTIVDLLPSLHTGKEKPLLLDFGCGDMPYRPLFMSRVGSYVGIDLPQNESADVHITTVDSRVPLPDASADIVLSTQVLEHVGDTSVYLGECSRLLGGGGLLILSTHGYWPYHPSPTDYWRWTGAGLRKILEESGFEVVRVVGIMGLAATAVQLFQDSLKRRVPRWFRPAFFLMMQLLVRLFDRLHSAEQRCRDASIFLVLARQETPK